MAKNKDITTKSKRSLSVTGSKSEAFTEVMGAQVMQTIQCTGLVEGEKEKQVEAMAATFAAVNPKNELEGMLASQMIAANNSLMHCFAEAAKQEKNVWGAINPTHGVEARSKLLTTASRLMDSFGSAIDTLQRMRGQGQERRSVIQHVSISDGGQAIIGSVNK